MNLAVLMQTAMASCGADAFPAKVNGAMCANAINPSSSLVLTYRRRPAGSTEPQTVDYNFAANNLVDTYFNPYDFVKDTDAGNMGTCVGTVRFGCKSSYTATVKSSAPYYCQHSQGGFGADPVASASVIEECACWVNSVGCT